MKLTELFGLDLLEAEIAAGYVSERWHDDDPNLAIYNYTKSAQAEKRWNDVTSRCRGLIVRYPVGDPWGDPTVVARPFEKFFNASEYPEGTFDLDVLVQVSDKQDGSLSILYPHPKGGYAIATRGSFHSEQAIKGTEILQRYPSFVPIPDVTYLFEVIYPENRIVLDYGSTEELVLLGCYDTETGNEVLSGVEFPFRRPTRWAGTLRQVLESADRENAEGWVARFVGGQHAGTRVKVKQEDYIRLHRIVTGLNELTVWEWIRDHGNTLSLVTSLPEEFESWVFAVEKKLLDADYAIRNRAYQDFRTLPHVGLAAGERTRDERAEFARSALTKEDAGLLFLLLDDKFGQFRKATWRMVRPKGVTPRAQFRTKPEPVAA